MARSYSHAGARHVRKEAPTSILKLARSPAAAFALLFPTIGFYTLAAYVNLIAPEGSAGSIAVRAGSLALLLLAFVSTPRTLKAPLPPQIIPAGLFLAIYTARLLENIVLQGVEIPPGNTLVLPIFLLSTLIPAYMLLRMHRGISDRHMLAVLGFFTYLFVVGMALNRSVLTDLGDQRLMLDKINPIALAYVCSSIGLYFIAFFGTSKRVKLEALIITPILLVIVALSRSRGMMIASGATVLIYVLALRGSRRIWVVLALAAAAALLFRVGKPEYFDAMFGALNRIDADSDMSTAGRIMSFEGAWHQFLDDPLLGRFILEQSTQYYPHNIYLESLMSTGLVGGIPFVLHFGFAARASLGLFREAQPSAAKTLVALLFLRDAIGAAGSGGLWSVSGLWITSFLVIGMWYARTKVPAPMRSGRRSHHAVARVERA